MSDELVDEGRGRAILVLHGGMGDVTSWSRVTDLLRDRFRVVRLTRRQYRLDVPRKVTMADEVAQVREVAATLDRPVLVGHSSGAVLALEALVADPGLYSGAVLYEPPIVLDEPLGGAKLEPARAAIAAGRPGRRCASSCGTWCGPGRSSPPWPAWCSRPSRSGRGGSIASWTTTTRSTLWGTGSRRTGKSIFRFCSWPATRARPTWANGSTRCGRRGPKPLA